MQKNFIFLAVIALSGAVNAVARDSTVIRSLEGEHWWGAATDLGPEMPFTPGRESIDQRHTNYNNQTTPLLVSDKGRYLWSGGALEIEFGDSTITVESNRGVVTQGGAEEKTLRGAYLAAVENHMKPQGGIPPEDFFATPTYNTWIELMYDQNQADILKYARGIIANGFEPGVLMIDDNWQKDYGDWEFRPDLFPSPKEMVDTLHSMGFKVMLWVCPFISPDCKDARDNHAKGYLVKDRAGNMGVLNWWNGYSACYDLSNPGAYAHLKQQLVNLQEKYGIDGFKFDAGDPERYLVENVSVYDGKSYDTEQSRLWAQLAEEFPYNELRACWQMGNRPLVQRLGDKDYSWEAVGRLVPSMVAAGLLGHPYTCPDMIGGGQWASFLNVDEDKFDGALIVRSCQIHSMMPMMQFSVAPWRVLNAADLAICRRYAALHQQMAPYILELARHASESGEPIVRHMAYEFPGEGFETVKDQYMLGHRYLVAPITTPEGNRTVKLPRGKWRDDLGKVIRGGKTIELTGVPLDRLPYYERL